MAGLVLLFAALAPTLAQAFAPRADASWNDICRAQGAARASAESGPSDDAGHAAHPFEHCPFCHLQAHGPALPPAPPSLPVLDGTEPLPRAFLAAPRSVHAWVSAQPRAPPALS